MGVFGIFFEIFMCDFWGFFLYVRSSSSSRSNNLWWDFQVKLWEFWEFFLKIDRNGEENFLCFFLKIFFSQTRTLSFFSSSLLMWFSPNSYFSVDWLWSFSFLSFLKFFKKTRGTWEDFNQRWFWFFSKIIKLIFWVVVFLRIIL
jgi:hypothetical protein